MARRHLTAQARDPVVDARGLTHRYRGRHGAVTPVDGLDLTVYPGEIVGVSGPSGTGKSTLLRLLAGIERPAAGTIHYGAQDAWPRRRGRRARYPRPGYVMPVFQDPAASLNPRWPLWRIITEPLTAPGRPRPRAAARRAAAVRALRDARLGHLDPDHRPGQLSGGQQQRTALLRALAANPALITADEPTARQDVLTAATITVLLTRAAQRGAAIVVVSHDTAWLHRIAHRTLHLPHPAGAAGQPPASPAIGSPW